MGGSNGTPVGGSRTGIAILTMGLGWVLVALCGRDLGGTSHPSPYHYVYNCSTCCALVVYFLCLFEQEEEELLKEMEVTGQAYEEKQEQNIRLVQQLKEKDDANFKLMSEV